MKIPTPVRQDNFFFLLAGLLLVLVAAPVVSEYMEPSWAIELEISFAGVLVMGVWSAYGSRRRFFLGIFLCAVCVLGTAAAVVLQSELARVVTLLAILIFLGLSGVSVLRLILNSGKVDLNTIVGAVCVYLMLGITWAVLYYLLESVVPGSFSGLDGYDARRWFWRLLFYSFVTLSTLAYGDIVPANAFSESMAYLEAIVGQLYVAVLVACLVGMYITGRASPRDLNRAEHGDSGQVGKGSPPDGG